MQIPTYPLHDLGIFFSFINYFFDFTIVHGHQIRAGCLLEFIYIYVVS
jgi:hypothetical protein